MKPEDRSWFNKTCADAVKSKEEAFIEWKLNPTPKNELLRNEARNRCNDVLKQQQFLYEQKFRRKVLDYSKGRISKNGEKCGKFVHTTFDKIWPDFHALG